MRTSAKRRFLSLLAIAVSLGGCQGQPSGAELPEEPTASSSQPGAPPSPEAVEAVPVLPLETEEDYCLHPLWPLPNGAAWTYQ